MASEADYVLERLLLWCMCTYGIHKFGLLKQDWGQFCAWLLPRLWHQYVSAFHDGFCKHPLKQSYLAAPRSTCIALAEQDEVVPSALPHLTWKRCVLPLHAIKSWPASFLGSFDHPNLILGSYIIFCATFSDFPFVKGVKGVLEQKTSG